MATTVRRPRVASPERWQAALSRAISEGIQVRQLAGCGAWIATSGSDTGTAYELAITGTVAHGCSCLAGLNDDPVCKHRAAFYLAAGLLDPDPLPPAPVVERVRCQDCLGDGFRKMMMGGHLSDWWAYPCHRCGGAGEVPVTILAA